MTEVDEESLEQRLWIALAEAGVLFGPGMSSICIKPCNWIVCVGKVFAGDSSQKEVDDGHFRISFSNAEVSYLRFW